MCSSEVVDRVAALLNKQADREAEGDVLVDEKAFWPFSHKKAEEAEVYVGLQRRRHSSWRPRVFGRSCLRTNHSHSN